METNTFDRNVLIFIASLINYVILNENLDCKIFYTPDLTIGVSKAIKKAVNYSLKQML